MPDAIERDAGLLETLDAIRRAASVAMGPAGDPVQAGKIASVPKVAMVCSPRPATTLSGRGLDASDMDIAVRMISVGQPHRATPLTGALCLAVATRVPGSIPNKLARAAPAEGSAIRIGHPSGLTLVDAKVESRGNGEVHAEYAAVYRTARRLFEGRVLCRLPAGVQRADS